MGLSRLGYCNHSVSGFFIYSFMYFNHGQMKEHLWPTLSLISIIEMPLIQRMEYLVLSFWLLKILSIITLGTWAACHCLKLERAIKPSLGLKLAIVLLPFFCLWLKTPWILIWSTRYTPERGNIDYVICPASVYHLAVPQESGGSTGHQDMPDQPKGEEA